MDGTHLYLRYKYKILIDVVLDVNHKVLPLAYAIVDKENIESWYWFLDLINHYVVHDRKHTYLILDRHAGLLAVVERVPTFQKLHGTHAYCLRHHCLNFNKVFRSQALKDLRWKVGSEHKLVGSIGAWKRYTESILIHGIGLWQLTK